MLIVALAVVLAIGCVGLSAERLRRVLRASRTEPEELVRRLRPASLERVEAVSRELPEGSSERELLEAVLRAPSREHGVAELNEYSSDIGAALASFGDVPRSAVRISLAGGAFLALVRLAGSMGAGGTAWSAALGAVAVGVVGAGISAELGRRADRIASRRRDHWNTLVQVLGSLLEERSSAAGSEGPSGSEGPRLQ